MTSRRTKLFRALAIVFPFLLIGMSLIVGFIAFAMFMPLIKLLNDLS